MYNVCNTFCCPYWAKIPMNNSDFSKIQLKDYVPQPFAVNIEEAAEQHSPRQTKEFTLSELAQFDGTMGRPAYVAVNGIVYDVSDNSKWSGAKHYGLTAGKDLTSQFESCHGIATKLAKLPKVGILKR